MVIVKVLILKIIKVKVLMMIVINFLLMPVVLFFCCVKYIVHYDVQKGLLQL